jgi:hypothetical protein
MKSFVFDGASVWNSPSKELRGEQIPVLLEVASKTTLPLTTLML